MVWFMGGMVLGAGSTIYVGYRWLRSQDIYQ